MAEFPALPLWTDALLGDTGHLTDAEFGLYVRVLILIWRTPGCRIPADLSWAARKLQRSEQDLAAIRDEFLQTDGNFLFQKRLSKEFSFQKKVRQRNSAKAKARWEKEKDPSHGNATRHGSGNAPSPSPSPSPSTQNRETIVSLSEQENGERETPIFKLESTKKIEADMAEAVRLWNVEAAKFQIAQVQKLSDPRKTSLAKRLNEDLGGIEGWKILLEKAFASNYLTGEKGWAMDFDWIIKPANVIKVMEGKYDNRPNKGDRRGALDDALRTLGDRLQKSPRTSDD